MDPNAAAAIMRDPTYDPDERLEAALALIDWLDKGGYPPTMYDHDGRHISFGGNTAARFAARREAQQYIRTLMHLEDNT